MCDVCVYILSCVGVTIDVGLDRSVNLLEPVGTTFNYNTFNLTVIITLRNYEH
jgi:hypothetical protein